MTPSDIPMKRFGSSVNIEQASESSQNFKMTRNSPILTIVAIATLVSVTILGLLIFFTHLKLVNQLETIVKNLQFPKVFNVSDHQLLEKLNSFNSLQLYSFGDSEENKAFYSQLFTFGGRDEKDIFLSSGSHFNSSTGRWRSIRSMPFAAIGMCGAVTGSNIYLFGGLKSNRSRSNQSTVYDSLADTYTFLPSMPKPRMACGAAVLDGYVYVAGGEDITSTDLSSVIRYNIQTNEWSTVSSMNNGRNGLELVELGGRLYAIGGRGTKTVEEYDPSADSWSFVASTQYQYEWFGAAVHKGEIYVIDRYGFEVYSPQTDQWKSLTMQYHDTYDFHNLVSMNGKLWAAGGAYKIDDDWEALKTVFTFDPSTEQWTKQRDMDVARNFNTAFVVNH